LHLAELARISHHGSSEASQMPLDARKATEATGGDLWRSPRRPTEPDAADGGSCGAAADSW